MAAYASLLSLMRIIEKLHLHPHPPPVSLNKEQVESLTAKITFFEEFLEAYNPLLGYSTEADPLETRIADAAYAAEDVIESNIVDSITNENMSSDGLYEGLEKVIQDMASIQKEAMDIRETMGLQLHHHTNSTPHQESLRSTSIAHNSRSMVGVDDVLFQIKDNLTSHSRHLQIIPIVGMGGSGKTTLASNIYQDPFIQDHFHVYAWATISQEYNIRGIFSQILGKLLKSEVDQLLSEDDLGNMLHKCLFGRKYLIIMDDMWNIEAWEKVRRFFPDNENGSRIVITTRLSSLASEITAGSKRIETRLLDENNSWNLLSKTVFGENGCPQELEEIGKKIAKSCKGLPLSIVVVGGVLAKSEHTREFWEYIEINLNSIVNSVQDESCLRILHMSYKQLPLYLKPCFLYMGVFGEDEVIRVSRLSRLWVAEGFLKPAKGKSLEEIAKDYIKDLTDRNLILIRLKGINGSIKECKIHDLLREFCLREAEKERFYVVARQDGPHQGVTITQRRIVFSKTSKKEDVDALQSVSLTRSLIWDREENPPSLNLRLLRIFECSREVELETMSELVNLRYLIINDLVDVESFSILKRFWNLETLYTNKSYFSCPLPAEIWCMPHIRHVVCLHGRLRDPPSGSQNDIVLENLHTLKGLKNFECSEEVVKRIPNVKKLGITYETHHGWSCLDNLACLVSLYCYFHIKMMPYSGQSLNFPQSLKKLKLGLKYSDCWQDILEKIGSLPLLEKLTLSHGCFEEGKWETAEGQFRSLKYLHVAECDNLKQWTMESSHFPRLEGLHLSGLWQLEEIPIEVAEIPTLGSIQLAYCTESAAISARRIVEEQEESNGEAAIQVRVTIFTNNEAVESLASHPNIQVECLKL